MSLPEFPVDELTLDLLEHALGTCLTYVGPDGEELTEPVPVGGEYTLSTLLDFLSGYDDDKKIFEGFIRGTEWYSYPDVIYSEHDVVRALIAEVRRLRALHEAPG